MKISGFISTLFLLALSALTFVPLLGRRDIVTSHEARVVQVARQMAASGWPWNAQPVSVDQVELRQTDQGERLVPKADGSTLRVNPWIVPVMNGQIRLQKPPLPYWCTAALYRLVEYNEMTSRLTSAVMGAISILLVWNLARRLIGRTGAWYAALVWVSSYFIVDEFRKSMADPYLAFFTLLSFWMLVRGCRIAFWIVLALGVLSKGPLIFLFLAIMVGVYRLLFRSKASPSTLPVPRGRIWMAHLIGMALFLLIVLPWGIAILRTVPNATELWRYESVGALSDKSEDARPWWFYLPNLLLITLPWTPLWVMGLILPVVHWRRRRFFGLIVTVITVGVLSLSYAKKNAYLLPLAPVQCVVAAQGLLWLTVICRRAGRRATIRRVTVAAVGLSVAVQVFVSGILAWQENRRSPREACIFVSGLLNDDTRASLLLSRMPEESTVYLPLGIRESRSSDEYYVVLDDRKSEADQRARAIISAGSRTVQSVENVPVPNSKVARWKVYRLRVSPVQSTMPGPG